MKLKYAAVLTAALGLLLVSCETTRNRENIAKLKPGMSKEEVLAVMGEPVQGEVYCKPDVLFYYTQCKCNDGSITSDECTPIVFEKGRLIGYGSDFYKDYIQKDWK